MKQALTFLTLALLFSRLHAGVLSSVSEQVRTTAYTGVLAYSDSDSGHVPDRSKISGQWSMDFTWDTLDTEGAMFESTMWFEDEEGDKVAIIPDGGGAAVTEIVEEHQVSLHSGNTTEQHTFGITFRPQQRLLPNKRYTMKAKYRGRTATGTYGAIFIMVTPHSSAASTQRYDHFTNFTSGDAALNARSSVELTSWNRRWMIQSSTTQDRFSANVQLRTARFDEIASEESYHSINSVISVQLLRVSDGALAWSSSDQTFSQLVPSHAGGTGAAAEPAVVTTNVQLEFAVPPGVLESDETYTPVLEVANNTFNGGPSDSLEGSRRFPAQRFLSLTGKIYFGSLLTFGNALTNDPVEDLYPNAMPLPTTTLVVSPGAGTLPDAPGASYGGDSLAVQIQANGDAVYGDGTEIAVSVDEDAQHQGVTYSRQDVVLTTSGVKANSMTVRLPRGLGYSIIPGTRVMKSKITKQNVVLQSNLLPAQTSAFNMSGTIYLTLERLPLVFTSSGLSFATTTGKFSFTPTSVLYDDALELGVLEGYAQANEVLWPAGLPLHAGNHQLFRSASVSGTDAVEVSVGNDGAAFIHTLKVGFNAGAWWTHFPTYWLVSTSGTGTQDSLFKITNDSVDQDSLLGGVQGIAAYYLPDTKPEAGKQECPGTVPAVGGRFFTLVNQAQELHFLADGSLDAAMTSYDGAATLNTFTWGTFQSTPTELFAHQINRTNSLGFTGNVMLPAHFLPWRGAAISGLNSADRTAALHLSGRGFGSGGTEVEYPHQAAYSTGLADYAGLNLRKSELTAFDGRIRIGGGPAADYGLLPETKLYIRSGGVSGTIQSPDDLGPVPVNGFDFTFAGVKLAFLDNCVAASALDGGVTVGGPAPANPCLFTVNFQGLRLWSNGALDRGTVDPNQGLKELAYWRTNIQPLTMSFMQPEACTGPAGETFLALGVDTMLPALTDKSLQGVLGFNANGSLVTRAQQTPEEFAFTQLDSRLQVPGNIKLKGPGSAHYSLTPVCAAYLNHWPGNGAVPTLGYASLAGSVDVPFFETLRSHLHASSDSNVSPNAIVHVMEPPEALGPFNMTEFDPGNLGVPSLSGSPINLETYRSHADYRVHARKNWLGLVNFDFPMRWSTSLRRFEMASSEAVISNLLVADVKSRARSLTPTTADLKFTAELGVSLPSIDANTLIGQALEGVGAGSPLEAIKSVLPSFGTVISDLASFEQLLADTPEHLVRNPLIQAVSAVRGSLPANANSVQLKNALVAHLNDAFSEPADLQNLNNSLTSWKQPVMVRMNKVDGISASLKSMISNAATVVAVADALAGVLGGADSNAVPEEVQETLGTAHAALTLLQSGISEVRSGLNALTLTPDWAPIIDAALADLPNSTTPLSQSNVEIAEAVLTRFLGNGAAAELSEEMRVHVSDTRDRLRGSVDAIFAGINEMLQAGSGVPPYLSPPSIGDLADLKFGKIDGQARINGDTLHELRLDADLRLAVGSDLDFHGYVLFRDLSSDTPTSNCRTSAGVAAELTLGATTKFSFGAPPSPTKLEVEAKFAFGESGGLNGLAGRFGVAGDGFKLGVLTIKQAELGFGFGGNDGYLYGKGAGQSDWADIEAAVFMGRTCNPQDVMQRVDPQVTELLNKPEVSAVMNGGSFPVYGLYAFGYGSISLNALIGIPPSPMLNLKAGSGMGAFYFVREQDSPPTPDDAYAAVIGLRQDYGASGEVLCLAHINARLSLVGATTFFTDDPLNVLPLLSDPLGHPILGNGQAKVSLKVGVSPFDVTLHKTLRMNFSYQSGQSPKFDLDL